MGEHVGECRCETCYTAIVKICEWDARRSFFICLTLAGIGDAGEVGGREFTFGGVRFAAREKIHAEAAVGSGDALL